MKKIRCFLCKNELINIEFDEYGMNAFCPRHGVVLLDEYDSEDEYKMTIDQLRELVG